MEFNCLHVHVPASLLPEDWVGPTLGLDKVITSKLPQLIVQEASVPITRCTVI
jgi:hypothetical protein